MDLLGGYGSASESDHEDHPQPASVSRPFTVSAAPSTAPSQPPVTPQHAEPDSAKDGNEAEEERPRLVAPAGPVLPDEEEDVGVGPSRPPATVVTDEKEIPSISNPEVWSKLPAPKAPAARRVIQMKLALHKSLLAHAKDDLDDEEDAAAARARKKARQGSGAKSALLDLLPAPKASLPGAGSGFGAAGGMIDLGDAFGSSSKGKAAARKSQGLDSDDEDPMARMGPMPEAGAYTAGPIADDGEDTEEGAAAGGSGAYHGAQLEGGYADASAYYVGGEDGSAAAAQYAYEAQQYAVTDQDPGQQLFQQALMAEQQRAAKRGEAFDMSSIQFKEVNANDLKHMDPGAREAQQAARSALGAEYAAQLRAQAKPFEGDKTAKRKHQIGTLFYNAKMKELEILEGKAAGYRAKGETKGKYGW